MNDYPKTIENSTLKLRPHSERDMEDIVRVGYDPELFRGIGGTVPDMPINEYAALWLKLKQDPTYSWAIEVDGKCVGSVWMHSIEKQNRRARYAIEIHDPAYRGKSIGKNATAEVIRVAFEQLKLHRLDLRVLISNTRAICCYEACGFRKEGVQRETLYLDGQWDSDLWMSILENEYREGRR